ncbi:MAG: hypothetical protein HYX51_11455 [Chloroflexi bacterium]|nr:hypothetical protein [Chloroflexota bacterium]
MLPRHHRRLLLSLGVLLLVAALAATARQRAGSTSPTFEVARSISTATAAATDQRDTPCPNAERLAAYFAPALALAPGDQAPRTVELLLDRAALVHGDGDRPAVETGVNPARLAQLADDPEAFLTLPPPVGDAAAQRTLYERAVASDTTGRYAVTTYASVYCDANTSGLGGRTIVQYWLFYLYNDSVNKHEGDWEMIQIVLGSDGRPQFAAYAQHNSYSWRDWNEMLIERRDTDGDGTMEEHPRVYVARGSHASYFQYAPGGYGLDVVEDAREFVIPTVRLLPRSADAEPARFGWLRFPGRWGSDVAAGQQCRGCERGPVGPAFNSGGAKWRTPLVWGGRRLSREDVLAYRTARVVVRTRGTVHFYDAQNRHTGPRPDGSVDRAAPGVAHLTRPGTDSQILLVPGMDARTPARIEVEGANIDLLELLLPEGDSAQQIRFEQAEIGPRGKARIILGKAALTLEIDADGDGRFERTLYPSAPPISMTPPEIR